MDAVSSLVVFLLLWWWVFLMSLPFRCQDRRRA